MTTPWWMGNVWKRLHCLWSGHNWRAIVFGDCVVVECLRCGYRIDSEFDGHQPYVSSYYNDHVLKNVPSKLMHRHPLEPYGHR